MRVQLFHAKRHYLNCCFFHIVSHKKTKTFLIYILKFLIKFKKLNFNFISLNANNFVKDIKFILNFHA